LSIAFSQSLGLVDADQVLECLRCTLVQLRQLGEHGLGTVSRPDFM
jgi:hypothetical protein